MLFEAKTSRISRSLPGESFEVVSIKDLMDRERIGGIEVNMRKREGVIDIGSLINCGRI